MAEPNNICRGQNKVTRNLNLRPAFYVFENRDGVADPRGIDFPYLLSMLHNSFMSRPNTIVCPGGKMDLAMQLIFTPMIWRLMDRRHQALEKG